ncbi:unnamed protein product [Periconia digitata]|uniref:Uncharacterized protein n=1 Tax=Periconia digitata TaxID=1303443 RepID=A0A9W4U6D6_9PLEO|nr:unnamed protein product [Periconia digitata]
MAVKDRVIVVTGAASGMGLETARLLGGHGAILSLADIQKQPLEAVEQELRESGVRVLASIVDVSNRENVESWISKTVQTFGKLDGAANIAGVFSEQGNIAGVADIDDKDWDFVFSVNVKGLLNCLRAEAPHMNEGSAIVNAASIMGLVGTKNNITYTASKHAVVGMTRALAREMGDRNVRVNCICPGPIDTPMWQGAISKTDWSHLALGRYATPNEVTPLVEFLLTPASSFITGVAMPIDGGWYC